MEKQVLHISRALLPSSSIPLSAMVERPVQTTSRCIEQLQGMQLYIGSFSFMGFLHVLQGFLSFDILSFIHVYVLLSLWKLCLGDECLGSVLESSGWYLKGAD